ncbi:MAG: gluconeogenesis factor YvcK family protein [Candidatus Polarisedimenticolia bacterium]
MSAVTQVAARWRSAGVTHDVRVAALGGGTGLPILLRGLRRWLGPRDPRCLTAIVSVADDGGSSGRLRRAFDVLPMGDLRNCLLALAEESTEMNELFSYRFDGNVDVGGHNLGNLILTALTDMGSGPSDAMERASRWLDVRGRVLPSSLEPVILKAHFEDGCIIEGESRIATSLQPIRRLELGPESVRACPPALNALREADLVLLGPGSLFTSLLPVLLVPGIAEAIVEGGARVALICNLLTEPGETDGFSAADFVVALRDHVPALPLHDLLLHEGSLPARALQDAAPARPVCIDEEPLRFLGIRTIRRDLAGAAAPLRHDPDKLGRLVREIALDVPCMASRS